MTINDNSGGANMSEKEDMDKSSRSVKDSAGITDEELILELDNMLEEDLPQANTEEIDEAALDMGLSSSEDIIEADEEILDLGESIEPESIGLDSNGLPDAEAIEGISDDDILDLSDDEHIEELVEELDEIVEDSGSDDDLLEIEDLVSDESLQYDPLLSKSKSDDLYIEEDTPRSSKRSDEYDDIDILTDYESGYEDDMGLEITSDMDMSDDTFSFAESSIASGLSIEQIEAAVERVVTRLFMDKMEAMLAEVIERVVREELSNLKKSLMDDAD